MLACGAAVGGGRRLGLMGVGRIVIEKPLLDLFFLSGQYDALPFHDAGALAVLSHDVGTLIEDLNQAVSLGPLEVVGRKCGVAVLHLYLG